MIGAPELMIIVIAIPIAVMIGLMIGAVILRAAVAMLTHSAVRMRIAASVFILATAGAVMASSAFAMTPVALRIITSPQTVTAGA